MKYAKNKKKYLLLPENSALKRTADPTKDVSFALFYNSKNLEKGKKFIVKFCIHNILVYTCLICLSHCCCLFSDKSYPANLRL